MQPPPAPLTLRTPPFAHYGVAWSPFHTQRIALASAANYGIVGNGRLHLTSITPLEIRLDKTFSAQDGLYDLAWSESHENQLVTASGDGSLKLWDIMLNDYPIRAWHEHTREAYSVDWSNLEKNIFLSCSWDGTIKLWSPDRVTSLRTVLAHTGCIYQALFSPHTPQIVATCSTDGTMKIFDMRLPLSTQPHSPAPASLVIPAHGNEILSLDWNKYRPFVLASASVDRTVKVWDCRMVKLGDTSAGPEVGGICERELRGHEYAVRKVQWSPHYADILASASYDMTARVWKTSTPALQPALLSIHDLHTEFVIGCAWSIYEEGILASCSWDHTLQVYHPSL
jgi:peroxin-7